MVVKNDLRFRAYVGYLKTGQITDELEIADVAVDLKLNTFGTMELKTPILDDLNRVWRTTTPWDRFLAITYAGRILEAGMIVRRSQNAAEDLVAVEAQGLWGVFDRRMNLNRAHLANGGSVATSHLSYRNLSLGSIAQRLCREQVEAVPQGYGLLPIEWSAEQSGTHEANYYGYNIKPVGEILRNITEYQRGPDIRFRPTFTDASGEAIRWVMEFGSQEQPLLFSPILHRWDAQFVDSSVEVATGSQDAAEATNTVYVQGNGEKEQMRIVAASNIDYDHPGTDAVFLETLMASKQVDSLQLLANYAQSYLNQNAAPWILWDISVRAEIAPVLGSYAPGDFVQIRLGEGPASLLGGEHIVRIMGVSARASGDVRLSIAPLRADGSSGTDDDGASAQTFDASTVIDLLTYAPRYLRAANAFEGLYDQIGNLQREGETLDEDEE